MQLTSFLQLLVENSLHVDSVPMESMENTGLVNQRTFW